MMQEAISSPHLVFIKKSRFSSPRQSKLNCHDDAEKIMLSKLIIQTVEFFRSWEGKWSNRHREGFLPRIFDEFSPFLERRPLSSVHWWDNWHGMRDTPCHIGMRSPLVTWFPVKEWILKFVRIRLFAKVECKKSFGSKRRMSLECFIFWLYVSAFDSEAKGYREATLRKFHLLFSCQSSPRRRIFYTIHFLLCELSIN